MKNILPTLVEKTGHYIGEGVNHENQKFTGELIITPLLNGKGLSLQFAATGLNGQVFHQEHSTIAPTMTGGTALWNFNSNIPSLLQHDLRKSESENGSLATYIFGFGNTPDNSTYPSSDELLAFGAPLGKATGRKKIGVHHEVLKPGRRTSWPHAESAEEEFAYVVSGYPSAWINGELYPLQPGDAVGFPAGTGVAHTFINNSPADSVLMVMGECDKDENKCVHPLHPKRNKEIKDSLWTDCPPQKMGLHDGLPDKQTKQI